MNEYAGPLQSVELATFLWLAPLVPLVAGIYVAFSGLVLARGVTTPRPWANPRNVVFGASLAALGLVLFHAVELKTDSTRALLSHAWGILRIGSLDTSFTLVLEPSNALLALGVSAVAVAAILAMPADSDDRRAVAAGVALAHSGMLLLVLANDWVLLLCGSNLVGVGVYSMFAGRDDAGAKQLFIVGRIGDGLVLGAGLVLLWGLGGSWTGRGDYVPDFRPRIVSVLRGEPAALAAKEPETRSRPESEEKARISSAALPGSRLSLGGAELCEVDRDGKAGGLGTIGRPCATRAQTPFANVRVSPALQDIRFHTGPGSNDLVVDKVRLGAGRETLLAVAGATLSMRDAREQLLMRDSTGAYPLRAALAKRTFFSLPLWGMIAGLLALGALTRVLFAGARFAVGLNSGATAAILATELLVGATIVSRADYAFALLPGLAAVTATIAALGALGLAARAAHADDTRAATVDVVGSGFALAIAGLALGAHASAVTMMLVTALAGAAFVLALAAVGASTLVTSVGSGRRVPDAKSVARLAALALSAAPVPLVFPRAGVVEQMARAEAFGMPVGLLLAGLCLVASGTAAFAVWRVCFVVFDGEPEKKYKPLRDPRSRAAVLVLGSLAIFASLLGLPRGVFGEGIPAPLEGWLSIVSISEMAAPGAPLERSVRSLLLGLVAVASVVGFVLARSRYKQRAGEWQKTESSRFGHAALLSSSRWSASTLVIPFTLVAGVAAKLDSLFERTALGMPPNDLDEDES